MFCLECVKKLEKYVKKKREFSLHTGTTSFSCSSVTGCGLMKLGRMLSTLQSHSFLMFTHRQERVNRELSHFSSEELRPKKTTTTSGNQVHIIAALLHSLLLSLAVSVAGLCDHPSYQGSFGRAQHHHTRTIPACKG